MRESKPAPEALLRAAEGAPVLSRPAPVGERVAGLASAVFLCAGLGAVGASALPLVVGVVAVLAALALVLAWRWHQLGAPRRRPHSRTEEGVYFLGVIMLGAPAAKILWQSPADLTASLVAAALPALCLAGYLVLRWRR